MESVTDLKAKRKKFLPKGGFGTPDSQTINGGIGDGKNDGGPAYCVGVEKE